jgi:hypothetical protein
MEVRHGKYSFDSAEPGIAWYGLGAVCQPLGVIPDIGAK